MNKICICKECNMRFINKIEVSTCPTCLSKSKENEDAFEVTPVNIMKLVDTLKSLTNERLIVNSLIELDFVLNRAYLNGYISEEFYEEVANNHGLVPKWDTWLCLNEDTKLDTSDLAIKGYAYDVYSLSIASSED